ncbi:MAG: serine/threonine protein kinase, partial [Chloroflexi bacterium]
MSSSLVGRTLGAYEIVELIGQGGMATVYKGFQKSVGRHVAIKVLPPHPGLNEQFITRFELEAKTIGALQHPHILPLYDYGRDDDILYLVMAYVDGGSLEERIKQGPMDVHEVDKLLKEVASALDYAHRKGIIHRDIKPGNILLDSEGHALLADFGIVKMVGGEGNLTGSGVIGTPAYMAPEQAQGMDIDHHVDIYALGVVVYEMLTGHQPYNAETPMKILLKHISDPVPNVLQARRDLPPALGDVMDRVLAKEPQLRYQSAVEFAEDFSRAVGGHETHASATRPQAHPAATVSGPTLQQTSPQQPATVIVQSSTWNNPVVLMAMFGIIAVVVVVVAV